MKTCQFYDGEPCINLVEGRTDYCSTHNRMMRKAEETAKREAEKLAKKILSQKAAQSKPKQPISKRSAKMKEQMAEYNEERIKWLLGKMCVVFPKEIATTIHHAKGRIGYADNEARLKGVTLLMDKRYWIPSSLEGHRYIEEHPQEAKDRGWSQSRLENLDIEQQTI